MLQAVHGVEVVNGDDWGTGVSGWRFWVDALNQGARLALVGGSDEHTPEEMADRQTGTPATIVFATALSEPAIVEGLKAGRTYVRVRGVRGPAIQFWATADGQQYELGEAMPAPAVVTLEAVVRGAAGQTLHWIRRGGRIESVAVRDGDILRTTLTADPGDWFSVVVEDADGPTLLTGAIYVDTR